MDTSYLAAFIDGEGSIEIRKMKTGMVLMVHITNTNKEVIDITQNTFGGKTFPINKHGKGKNQYRVWWSGNEAKLILELVREKLIIKKYHCEIALGFPIFKQHERYGHSQEERELREHCFLILKQLNKRGI